MQFGYGFQRPASLLIRHCIQHRLHSLSSPQCAKTCHCAPEYRLCRSSGVPALLAPRLSAPRLHTGGEDSRLHGSRTQRKRSCQRHLSCLAHEADRVGEDNPRLSTQHKKVHSWVIVVSKQSPGSPYRMRSQPGLRLRLVWRFAVSVRARLRGVCRLPVYILAGSPCMLQAVVIRLGCACRFIAITGAVQFYRQVCQSAQSEAARLPLRLSVAFKPQNSRDDSWGLAMCLHGDGSALCRHCAIHCASTVSLRAPPVFCRASARALPCSAVLRQARVEVYWRIHCLFLELTGLYPLVYVRGASPQHVDILAGSHEARLHCNP